VSAVSIVIPVHGRAHLTERCLDLVLDGLAADCEVIVVDDASDDGTPELLAGYGERIRVVSLDVNAGFATACNRGAAAASGERLVFLNNDTEPQAGWLAALRRYADEHPQAAVVGAKLLYPTGIVQHAGVVFGQDGYPHHLYAGFPAEHPAVSHPRRLQAVTAACMLVGRETFEQVGGFDPGFHNSLEDVDLCLRIGEAGGEVHYCEEALLVHLESASRGRSDRFEGSVALYRERWRDRVRRDDLGAYVADGLLAVEYAETHPIRLTVDPALAIVDRGREEEIERLLEAYARQSAALLTELVRLTAASVAPQRSSPRYAGTKAAPTDSGGAFDREGFLGRVRAIEEEIRDLQAEAAPFTGVEPSATLGYGSLTETVRAAVEEHVPPGAAVLVLSRGDRELIRFRDRRGAHFPQDGDGRYAGYHPADSAEAITALEGLREKGARFLVVPPPSAWWLDHYDGFARHLARYRLLAAKDCEIYDLGEPVSAGPLDRLPATHIRGDLEAVTDERGITVHGWAFGKDRQAVAAEVVDEAGRVLGRAPIGLDRPDVVHGVGEVPGALRSGFMVRLEPRRPGRETLAIRIFSEDGGSEVLGTFEVSAGFGGDPDADGPGWVCSVDSPERGRVVIGREGWLFLQEDRNDALGQHTGRVRFSPQDKESLAALLRERRAVVESYGSIWITAVVPDKEAVYAEFLPPDIAPVARRPEHDFLEIAEAEGAAAIYLLDDLRAAKAQGDLYMRTDTHWNHRGAFVAYQAVCREIAARGLDLELVDPRSISWIEQPVQGDLGSKLYPEIVEGKDVFPRLAGRVRGELVYDNRVRNHGMVLIHQQRDRDDLPTCMVFGESFAPPLVNFLKESFGRVIFVHTSMLVADLIERECPDVVLSVPTERFLISVPDDAEALQRLAEAARGKGGELPWSTSGDPSRMPA
jgi:GT2 family glycosyltransferase